MMSGEAGGFAMGTHYQGHAGEVRALDALIKLVRCVTSLQGRLEIGIREEGFTQSQFGVLEALLHLGPLEPARRPASACRSPSCPSAAWLPSRDSPSSRSCPPTAPP